MFILVTMVTNDYNDDNNAGDYNDDGGGDIVK